MTTESPLHTGDAENQKTDANNQAPGSNDKIPKAEIAKPSPPPQNQESVKNTQQPRNQPEKPKSHPPNWAEIVMLFLEALALVGLVWYCVINQGELNVFSAESKTMDAEFKASETNAVVQYKIAQKQLEQTTAANQMDQRGWLFITMPNDALDISGSNAIITMTDKNIGKTPVLVTHTFGTVAIDPNKIPPHDFLGSENSLMLIPNQEGKVIESLPDVVKQGILANVKVYIYGTVRYRDVFQKDHWSQFCFLFDQNGRLMLSQNFHNSCDDLDANTQN